MNKIKSIFAATSDRKISIKLRIGQEHLVVRLIVIIKPLNHPQASSIPYTLKKHDSQL